MRTKDIAGEERVKERQDNLKEDIRDYVKRIIYTKNRMYHDKKVRRD